MEKAVKKLLSEVISASIEQYEQHRGVYVKDSEWTNDAIGKALMNTMEVKFKTLNLLYVSDMFCQCSEKEPYTHKDGITYCNKCKQEIV